MSLGCHESGKPHRQFALKSKGCIASKANQQVAVFHNSSCLSGGLRLFKVQRGNPTLVPVFCPLPIRCAVGGNVSRLERTRLWRREVVERNIKFGRTARIQQVTFCWVTPGGLGSGGC